MKGCSSLGAIFILVIGVLMTAVTVYGYFRPQLFFNEVDERNMILGIMLGADLLIILSAILGLCGIKKGSVGLICIFQIFVIVFFAMFLGLGIGAELLPGTVFEGNCTDSPNAIIKQTYQAYQLSQLSLCTTNCQCNLTDQTIAGPTYTDA